MKDVTKELFEQTRNYEKRANLNLTRTDIYVNSMNNIYDRLGKDKIQLKIRLNKTVTRQFPATKKQAVETLREYAKIYFLDVTYANDWSSVTIRLKRFVPDWREKLRKEKERVD